MILQARGNAKFVIAMGSVLPCQKMAVCHSDSSVLFRRMYTMLLEIRQLRLQHSLYDAIMSQRAWNSQTEALE